MTHKPPSILLLALTLGALAPMIYANDAQKAEVSAKKAERANCLKQTGSRIKPADGQCIESPGHVITREQIEQSGAFDTGDAIDKLAPEAQVRRH